MRFLKVLILISLTCVTVACTQAHPSPSQTPDRVMGQRGPGARVSVLATFSLGGQRWKLVSFRDPTGAKCIAVDHAGQDGTPACNIQIDAQYPVNEALQNFGHGILAVYGRASSAVERLYALTPDGQRIDEPIHADSRDPERYFAILISGHSITDVVAITAAGTFSLKQRLDDFYSTQPH